MQNRKQVISGRAVSRTPKRRRKIAQTLPLTAAATAAVACFFTGPAQANTADNVINGSADLTNGASYSSGTWATSSDVDFTNVTYSTMAFTLNTNAFNLSVGTLDDLDATQTLTIDNTNGSGTSTITLNGGSNSVSGTAGDLLYVASGGTFSIATASTGTLDLALAASGNFDVVGTANIGAVISGAGLTKTGTGSLYIPYSVTSNTYTGGTTINAGLLGIGNSGASATPPAPGTYQPLGTGTVTVNSGGTLELGAVGSTANSYTYANNITLGGGTISTYDGTNHLSGTVTVNSGSTLAASFNDNGKGFYVDGLLSGSGNLTLQDSGLQTGNSYDGSTIHFTNAGTSTYNGTIAITPMSGSNGGSYLELDAAGALANATINLTGNNTASNVQHGTGTFLFANGLTSATIGGLSGSGSFVLGQLTSLTGTPSTTAGVALSVGNNGSSTTFSGVISGAGSLAEIGGGTTDFSGANTLSGGSTIQNGTVLIGVSNATTISGALGPSTATVTLGNSSGTSNASLLTNGAFTFSNAITVAAGSSGNTLIIGGNTANSSTFSGVTTLDNNLMVSQVTSGTTNLTGNITSGAASGTQTVTFNNAGSVSQSTGVISNGSTGGTVALAQIGAGTTTLSGANTFTGGFTLSAGTLTVGASSAGNAGAVTAGPLGTGTLALYGGSFNSSGVYTINNAINAVSGTTTMGGSQNLTLGGAITGSGTISAGSPGSASSNYFQGNLSSFTGTFNFTTYSTSNERFGSGSNQTINASQATFIINNGTGSARNVAINDTYINDILEMGALSGNGVLEGSYTGSGNTYAIGYLNTNTTFSGTLSDSTSSGQAAYSVTKVGTGSLTLSGTASEYTGATTIENGSLIVGAAVPSSGNGPFGSATTAIALGDATSLSSSDTPSLLIGGAFSVGRNITVGSATGANSSVYTIGGSTDSNATFSGNISLNQSLTVSQVANAGTNALAISGIISGASSAQTVTFVGPGNIRLSAANTYPGTTTISAGTLQLGNALAVQNSTVSIGTTNDLTFLTGIGSFTIGGLSGSGNEALTDTGSNAVALTVGNNNNSGMTYSGVLSGSGSLIKTGTGVQTLSGPSTFTGGVTLSAGALAVGANSTPTSGTVTSGPLGTGTLTLADGTFEPSVNSATIGNTINVTAAATLLNNGLNWTLNGNITGNGNLTQTDPGTASTLTLGGNNSSYSGTFTQSADNSALAFGSAVSGSANAAWVFNDSTASRTRFSFGNGTINLGSLAGTGSLVNQTGSASTAILSVGALNTNTTFSGTIIANGTQAIALTKVGAGTLTLTGANTYTAGTTISAGTIEAIGTALSNGPVTVAGGTIAVNDGVTTTAQSLTTGDQTWKANSAYTARVFNNGTADKMNITAGTDTLTFDSSISNSNPFTVNATATAGSLSSTTTEDWVIAGGMTSLPGLTSLGYAAPTSGNPTVLATAGAAANSSPFVLNIPSGLFSSGYAAGAPMLELESVGGTSYSLDVVYNATPEPGTAMLVLGGSLPMLMGRRRRCGQNTAG